jgi:hypothetical protein
VGFPAPTRAVDEEEIRWYRPVRVCSPESGDVVGCVEAVCEGVRDGVVSDSLEVVEAGFLLCDLPGEGFAVVKKVGLQKIRLQVMARRKWRNGEAVLLETVVPTGKEAL